MTPLYSKSEAAFNEWYIPLVEDPMPSQIWDAAVEWATQEMVKGIQQREAA